MNNLQVIVHDNRRVLTTGQLAESYGTDAKQISYNFNYNKERYQEGKHFFSLESEEKRGFINRHEIQDGSINAKTLYLWTEKGAWLHAKSLNTDKAWDAYEMLVDEYYKMLEVKPMTQMEIIAAQAQQMVEQERKMKEIEQKQHSLQIEHESMKEVLGAQYDNWRKSTNSIINKICYNTGMKQSEIRNIAYSLLEDRAGCRLEQRLNNMKARCLSEKNWSKSKIEKLIILDVIENENKLVQIFVSIVKELAIKYGI